VRRVLDGNQFETKLAVGTWQSAGEVMKEIDKDAVFYEESGGGVTFSGGEPLMQPEALYELLVLCRERDYLTAIDTCGHAEPSVLSSIMELADLWMFDLKLIDDYKHVKYTGVSNELALKNLETLALASKCIIIRLPLIPGINDGIDNLEAIANQMTRLRLKKIDLLPYHTIAKDKYRRMGMEFKLEEVKEVSESKIDEVIKFFTGKGFTVGIGG
jgi:pyruvate formate lyase activating enzyme